MRTKEIGGKYRFTYPNYGNPDSYPEYTAHSGQIVTVLRKLEPNKYHEHLYEVQAEDGWKGSVVSDDLRKYKEPKKKK